MKKVKLGLIQVKQREEDSYEARLDILYQGAEACFAEGADLVFFPESYQYQTTEKGIVARAEDLIRLSGQWKKRCAALARQYHAYLVPWDYEYSEGKIYNTSYILNRNGEEIGRYRKVHLTYNEQERGISNGKDFLVFDLDIGKVGIMICFDNYFPESARCLGNRGARLVLYPLYGDTLIPQWELKVRTRAADNSMYVASCQIDTYNMGAFTGVIDPNGNILEKAEEAPSYRVVEIDMDQTVITHTTGRQDIQEQIRPYLARCRRPDAYSGILTDPGQMSWKKIFCGNPPVIPDDQKSNR